MTRDDKDKSSKAIKQKRNLQRVEDMYRIADQAHGGFAEAERSGFKGADRNQDIASGPEAEDTWVRSDHGWVLHVLSDLAAYAKEERLDLVRVCLEDARYCVEQMLKEKASKKGRPASGGPGDDDR